MTESSNRFTKPQLEILSMFARDLPMEQWMELRQLIFQFFLQKAIEAADKTTEGWTQEDFERLLHTHYRKPYHTSN